MSWTDDRVEKLKEFWEAGLSASQIAKQLGGVTRNAVIGKVHRLGLTSRGGQEKKAQEKAPRPERPAKPEGQAKEAAPVTEPPPPPVARPPAPVRDVTQPREPGQPTPEEAAARETLAEIEKLARRLDLMQLTERTCKWPIGDPAEDEFYFCGLPSVPGKPYCEHHVAVAYQPMSARRDRVRSAR